MLQRKTLVLMLFSAGLHAQTWTQVSMPNLTQYLTGSSYTPTQPSLPSPNNRALINNPGVNNSPYTGGAYVSGCYYGNGPSLWWDGRMYGYTWIYPGGQKVTGPAAYLTTDYINWWDAFYGVEFNGSFQGATNSGQGAVFYSDDPCLAGGREYGVRYNYSNGGLQLYWSSTTNCGPSGSALCWNDSTSRQAYNQIPETSDACVINTSVVNPSQYWVYDIWFSGGSIHCEVKDPNSFSPVPYAFYGHSAFSYDSNGYVFSGPVPAWFPAPAPLSLYGAGYIFANMVPTIVNPNGDAYLSISWVKAAK